MSSEENRSPTANLNTSAAAQRVLPEAMSGAFREARFQARGKDSPIGFMTKIEPKQKKGWESIDYIGILGLAGNHPAK